MNPAKTAEKTDVTFSVDLACALDARRMQTMREKQGNMRTCRIKPEKNACTQLETGAIWESGP